MPNNDSKNPPTNEMSTAPDFHVGDWLARPSLNQLQRGDESVTIENKAMDVLALLAKTRGELVTNDEIIAAVWQNRPMGDNPVYKCINQIRRALGDDPRNPHYIETIPKRGYRLIADVVATTPSHASPAKLRRIGLIIGAIVVALAITVWFDRPTPVSGPPASGGASIAILPFENLAGADQDSLIAAGIAEEILNRLARRKKLRVIARTSSFASGSNPDDLQGYMRKLDVNYLLQGSIQIDEPRLRLTVRLVSETAGIEWSESFERDTSDIFTLQDEVAQRVVERLTASMDEEPAVVAGTDDFRAYRAYLLGKELLSRRPSGWVPDAVDAFQEAIRLDPTFPDPYAGIAIIELIVGMSDTSRMDVARNAIDTALDLDPSNAAALAALGLLQTRVGTEEAHHSAIELFHRSLEINPSSVETLNWLSIALRVVGERKESDDVLRKALKIDPLNVTLNANYGARLHSDGQLAAAREQFEQSLALPDFQSYMHTWAAAVELSAGDYYAALARVKQGLDYGALDDDNNRWYAQELARHYAYIGLFDSANAWLAVAQGPDASHWRLATQYTTLRLQNRFDLLTEVVDRHLKALGDQELTLLSRSVVASVALHNGEPQVAIDYLSPIFQSGWVLANEPGGSSDLIETAQLLAMAYQQVGRDIDALQLLQETRAHQDWMRTGRTKVLSGNLADEAVTHALLGEMETARLRFQAAVDAGWRNYYDALHGVRWDALRTDPVFSDLLEIVREDLEIQRQQVIVEEQQRPLPIPAAG